jgi:hypothetical protein
MKARDRTTNANRYKGKNFLNILFPPIKNFNPAGNYEPEKYLSQDA